MKYIEIENAEDKDAAELQFLNQLMDRLEAVQSEIGRIVGELDQFHVGRRNAHEGKNKEQTVGK